MKNLHVVYRLITVVLLALPVPSFAAVQTVVVENGLSLPVFVGNAGDGTNRLFIEEQIGVIRVLQPGASVSSVFLDIRSRVLASGDLGLLGLAFHPQFASNGRFFVYYTRSGDGAMVVSEFRVGANPNVASSNENVLLAIPRPILPGHNGGMLAFGADGYLYISVGDCSSANDPPNFAQNIEVLFGKILRIDVDRPDAAARRLYSSPPDNPYVGKAGRDEIFAIGWRNPWRFSFDRSTHQLWVADVGQDSQEEVDAPVVKGGNYGWRVYEGTDCTNNDPQSCDAKNYIAPMFAYPHTGGRCAITGGYVYRGTRNTLPPGTYVYGDFCTGEIFAWDGTAQTVLLDTMMSISSFGEDEQGELYVVDIDGAVSKIVSTAAPGTVSRVIEYYHAGFNHYFMTVMPDEITKLDNGTFEGWRRTGLSFNPSPAGSADATTVCRFFSTAFGLKSSHFYTSNPTECAIVKTNPDWRFEGEVFNMTSPIAGTGDCQSGLQPLYRMYNNGEGGAPNHRYTTDLAVRESMRALGWIAEGDGIGVVGCVPM
jgi:glucose/arabinose dehydrogenase